MSNGLRYRKIAIWGHYHGGNLGDEVVVDVLIENISSRQPEAEIIGICLNPADAEKRHGIVSLPMTRGARAAKPRLLDAQAERVPAYSSIRKTSRLRTWLRDLPLLGSALRWLRKRFTDLTKIFRSGWGILAEPAFLWSSFQAISALDVFVVSGSGPLFDSWSGPWGHPYNLFKWTFLARLAGARIIVPSVGAGPIESPLSRLFFRRALHSADYVSFRDPSSKDLVISLGLARDGPVVPDQAFLIRVEQSGRTATPERQLIGVNPMAHEDPRYMPRGRRKFYEAYLDKLTRFVGCLLEEGHDVRLFYTQLGRDLQVCRELEAGLARSGHLAAGQSLLRREIYNWKEALEDIGRCHLVVASRFHGIVFSAISGLPVIGLAYNQKTYDLLGYLGEPSLAVDINDFETEDLVRQVEQLRVREKEISESFEAHIAVCRRALVRQYDDLFGPQRARK